MNEAGVVAELAGLVDRLAEVPSAVDDDAARIDVIAGLERLKAAAYAAQLQVIGEFAASQEAANKALGLQERVARRGIPEQVGLARKVSPTSAARQISQARALMQQLPETFELVRRGEVSEFVATIVTNETSHLGAEDRRLVDLVLADELAGLSPRRAEAAARRWAIEADPAGAVQRAGKAREDRRVSIRAAPDTMTVLSALLPCEQGVAAYAALRRDADTRAGVGGEQRSRSQIMADTLVERLTGQTAAGDVPAEIAVVMTDASLFGGDATAAELIGYGPIPAATVRDIARPADTSDADNHGTGTGTGTGTDDEHTAGAAADVAAAGDAAASERDGARARVFLRRLFTDPVTGILTDLDPRRRRFDGVLAKLLVYRDQGRCREPHCDAPIRHLDHIQPYAAGGPTTPGNGRGQCERGNHTNQMPGFTSRVIDTDRHIVETTTPTGHRYRSAPPRAPGTRKPLRHPLRT